MKAIQAMQFGDPEVLTVVELPDPAPGPGQVAIEVSHAVVGLVDVFIRKGYFKDAPGMARPPFIPGLEVAGVVKTLGVGVTGLSVGERVVAMSSSGTGGYASCYIANANLVASIEASKIRPELAVSVVPNAAMAHLAFTKVAHLKAGESVLVSGALGGFASAFPGMAKWLGASLVDGAVRSDRMASAQKSKLPYDHIFDSSKLNEIGTKFDVIIDPVGGSIRSELLAFLKPSGRLIAVGNASEDWTHQIKSNDLWLGNISIAGFNAGAYLPAHPDAVQPALEAALKVVAKGLGDVEIHSYTFDQAAEAHKKMEDRNLVGRIVLVPNT
jgi:NADPH2:quinone reductase